MADKELAKLLETQVSLTEWIRSINPEEGAQLAEEDNHKRERLGVLNSIIGIPFDKPTKFEAQALRDKTPELQKFLDEHGHELCALRLNPKPGKGNLQKMRMRGKTVLGAMEWFASQDIDPKHYTADFVPHPHGYRWATIFVVNSHGIFGEIYFGGHHILTQGFHTDSPPTVFSHDFNKWQLDPKNEEAEAYLKELVAMIHVPRKEKQEEITERLQGSFSHNYLNGYFESTQTDEGVTWFIDYNRILGERYRDFVTGTTDDSGTSLVQGHMASPGTAEGTAKVVTDSNSTNFQRGDILVCRMTSPDYLPLMQKAAAIITDEGGVLCHAAIVARELGIPCIVGTGKATKLLDNKKLRIQAEHCLVQEI